MNGTQILLKMLNQMIFLNKKECLINKALRILFYNPMTCFRSESYRKNQNIHKRSKNIQTKIRINPFPFPNMPKIKRKYY